METIPTAAPTHVLRRCPHHRLLGGVAAGLADHLDVDPAVVRAAFVVLVLIGGLAVPLYLAAWLLLPEEGSDTSVAQELLGSTGRA